MPSHIYIIIHFEYDVCMNVKQNTGEIIFTIKEACVSVGIYNAHQLHLRSGLHYRVCRKLYKNQVGGITPKTFAALCFTLKCKITSPLMVYVPPGRKKSAGAGRKKTGGKQARASKSTRQKRTGKRPAKRK